MDGSFSITVIQVYGLTSNAEEAEVEQFYEDLQELLKLAPKKDVPTRNPKEAKVERFCEDLQDLLEQLKRRPFHYRGLECKSQEKPGVTDKFVLGVQNEAKG